MDSFSTPARSLIYVTPVSGGPPNPHGVTVVQIVSPAYHTSSEVRKAAPTRGSVDSAMVGAPVKSITEALWLPWASRGVYVTCFPSALARGWIQLTRAGT